MSAASGESTTLDVAAIKADFPILNKPINDRPLVFLDSASTSQKPMQVLDTMRDYYESTNANVHRGAYFLSDKASRAMEGARKKVAQFIGAPDSDEVIFTKNATEALNLIAASWGRANLHKGDVVVLSLIEHHANIVPWHMLAADRGIELRFIGIGDDGLLDLSNLDELLEGAKLVSVTAMGNVTGAIVPVERIANAAHAVGALCAVDACQLVPHVPTNVAELDIDFAAFSGHKMCGPTGIGVLWARKKILEAMPPFLGGGGMIANVTIDGFTTADLPHKFEAGTPPIAEIVGLGAAVDYLTAIGMENIRRHEVELSAYFMRSMKERHGDDVIIHGPAEPAQRGGVFSFAYKDVHPHDLSQVLDEHGINVRAGHHCAKPLMKELGVGATARASLYIYNDESDVDRLVEALDNASDLFSL
ncbi:MAG: cysteine desulfurase/selenocysteine lyase [Candidatus Poriferisodalaceae bacterium]